MYEEEVVYKVVRREERRLISSNSPFCKDDQAKYSDWIVEYKPNEWAKPHVKGTKLFCCRRYIDALNFAEGRSDSELYEVWEAKAIGVLSLPPTMRFLYMTWGRYRSNWTNKHPRQGEKAFYGMVLADEIMLVRRIEAKNEN